MLSNIPLCLFLLFAHTSYADVELVTYSSDFTSAATASSATNANQIKADAGVATASPVTQEGDLVGPATPAPFPQRPIPAGAARAFIPDNASLAAALPQASTNGNSPWGTQNAPQPALFLDGPTENGFPWGSASARTTNYYQEMPNTGVTRRYVFNIERKVIAPDGVEKEAITVNGGFPGPLIEANWGDWVSVTVNNKLANEGTAIHWHGLLQKDTPYYDGVPSVHQCPIAPGKSFTYRFRADLYGSSWYHAHYSAMYAAGVVGPMVIHGPVPSEIQYDADFPIMLGDWYHSEYSDLVRQTMAPASAGAPPPVSNNSLINGKMNYPCSATTRRCTPNAGLAKFKFQSGKTYRLRLINTSAEALLKFSIDNHNMTVFANDYVEVEPYTTNVVTLGVGQRSDVIVKATGKPTDVVWMRSNISLPCSLNDGVSPGGLAVIQYEKAKDTAVPKTSSSVTEAQMQNCKNDDLSLTKPYLPIEPPADAAVTSEYNINFQLNTSGFNVWTINDKTYRANFNDPVLLDAKLGQTEFPEQYRVLNFGSNATIRFVVYNYFQFAPHPMHMHGHNMYVLAEGYGTWDGHITNPSNPQRRDVHMLPAAQSATVPSYLAIQIDADNPGVWPWHCHVAWHASAGLVTSVLSRPADINEMDIPMVMQKTCKDWDAWSKSHIVDQIDSGV